MNENTYTQFLKSKVKLAAASGLPLELADINPALKLHQRAMVKWMVNGGCRALFASFGLGKSVVQLEAMRLILKQKGGRALIVCPLGVRQEFITDAQKVLGWSELPKFIQLSTGYWADSVAYCQAKEAELSMPSLFDLEGIGANAETSEVAA